MEVTTFLVLRFLLYGYIYLEIYVYLYFIAHCCLAIEIACFRMQEMLLCELPIWVWWSVQKGMYNLENLDYVYISISAFYVLWKFPNNFAAHK